MSYFCVIRTCISQLVNWFMNITSRSPIASLCTSHNIYSQIRCCQVLQKTKSVSPVFQYSSSVHWIVTPEYLFATLYGCVTMYSCCMPSMLIAWSGLLKRKTMVLDLDETLIHSHHDGWVGLTVHRLLLVVGDMCHHCTTIHSHMHACVCTYTRAHTHTLPVCITDPINQYHQLLHQTLYLEWVNSYCTMMTRCHKLASCVFGL